MKSIFLTITFSLTVVFAFAQNKDYGKAETHFMLRSYNEAATYYEKSFDKSPDFTESIEKAAYCYELTYQFDKAVAAYNKLFQKGKPTEDAVIAYGQLLKQMGKYEQSRSLFENISDVILRNHFVKSVDFAKAINEQEMAYRIDPEYLNTSEADFGAAFYNGEVVYTSFRNDFKRKVVGKQKKEQNEISYLYKTKADKTGFLSTPKFLRSTLHDNDMFGEAYISQVEEDKTIAFVQGQATNGINLAKPEAWIGSGIYLAKGSSNGDWNEAQAFRYNLAAYANGFPFITKDGSAIYFSSNQAGGFGGFDIYVSYKDGDSWSAPENLGDIVNTPGDEISPFLLGETLYFSSDWHWGLGGQDVFRAEKIGDEFEKIIHLGSGINSNKDDYNFIYDDAKDIGYMTSNRKGASNLEDIYRVKEIHGDLIVKIVDDANRSPIADATIDMTDCSGGKVYTTNAAGKLTLSNPNINCSLQIMKAGFETQTIRFKNKSGVVEVGLTKAPTEAEQIIEEIVIEEPRHKGQVVGQKGQGIEGVKVSVFNKETGESAETWTDEFGFYKIRIGEGQAHDIKFSKENHIEVSQQLVGPSIRDLGLAMMINIDEIPTESEETPAIVNVETVVETPVVEEEMQARGIAEGYVVQIMSLSKKRTDNLDFSNLKDVGYVYNTTTKDWVRYLVGVFVTRTEAESALEQVKDRGYERAFIKAIEVTDNNRDFLLMGSTAFVPESFEKDVLQPKGLTYEIQLAVYKDIKWFEKEAVEELGELEYEETQGRTIVRLKGIETLEKANEILNKVYKVGFTDAFIVE